jgi:hypothetical protein
MDITVTHEDLDAAVARRQGPDYRASHHCVFAHALDRHGVQHYGCSSAGTADYSPATKADERALKNLVNNFDHRNYDDVSGMLPLTITMREGL